MVHKKRKNHILVFYMDFLRRNWIRLILVIGYQIFMAFTIIQDMMLGGENVTFGDCWYASFAGALEMSGEDKFELPVLWMIFHALMLYLMFDYLSDCSKGVGLQQLLRMRNRKKWYWELCCIMISNILGYYAVYFIILRIVSGFYNISFALVESQMNTFIGNFVLLACTSLALFFIQNLIGIFCNEMIAYMISLGGLVISVYWKSYWLLGNYAMLSRVNLYREDGLSISTGIVLCIIITVIAILCGMVGISKKDIL